MEAQTKKEFMVFNATDGIKASMNNFKTRKEAQEFIKAFRKQYEHQGYYYTFNCERINPKDLVLEIKEVEAEEEEVEE